MRILCTGLSGFIGSALYPRLINSKHKIAVITRQKNFKNCINIQSDLQSVKDIEKEVISFNPDILLHLAWEGIPNFTYSNCMININTSTQLFELVANKTKCKKIISTGSCFEYGKHQGPCKEDEDLNINSLFSWSKNALTNYLKYLHINNDLDYFWFRVFYAYGPKQRAGSLIPTIISSVKENKKPDIRSPQNSNDFIYVDDVVDILMQSIDIEGKSGIYNLGSGTASSIEEIYNNITMIISKKLEKLTSAAGNQAEANSLVNFWSDNNNLQNTFDTSNFHSLEEGLRKTIKLEFPNT